MSRWGQGQSRDVVIFEMIADTIRIMSGFLLPLVNDWARWSTIFTDAGLWWPIIERVWRMDGQLRGASGLDHPTAVASGHPGTCAVFVVDDVAVIKFFPPMVAHDFERELAVYRLLHDHLPKMPTLLGYGRYQDRIEWPYLAVSFLPGVAWREVGRRVPPIRAAEIMTELGQIIRAIHDIRLPPSGSWPAAGAWELLVQSRLARAGDDLRRGTHLSEATIEEIESMLLRWKWHGEPVHLLHSDLTEDHLLIAESDGNWSITGLIDWADAEVGPRAYDWVALWFSVCRRDPALFRAFLRGYGAPLEGDVHQLTAMTFLHRFGANIIADTLSPEEQRAIGSLTELIHILFGALASPSQAPAR